MNSGVSGVSSVRQTTCLLLSQKTDAYSEQRPGENVCARVCVRARARTCWLLSFPGCRRWALCVPGKPAVGQGRPRALAVRLRFLTASPSACLVSWAPAGADSWRAHDRALGHRRGRAPPPRTEAPFPLEDTHLSAPASCFHNRKAACRRCRQEPGLHFPRLRWCWQPPAGNASSICAFRGAPPENGVAPPFALTHGLLGEPGSPARPRGLCPSWFAHKSVGPLSLSAPTVLGSTSRVGLLGQNKAALGEVCAAQFGLLFCFWSESRKNTDFIF